MLLRVMIITNPILCKNYSQNLQKTEVLKMVCPKLKGYVINLVIVKVIL
tara:strand:- start:3369 stop:3515 length:147 start_codon:yes stop_codon:yes gene_type:complete